MNIKKILTDKINEPPDKTRTAIKMPVSLPEASTKARIAITAIITRINEMARKTVPIILKMAN